MNEEMMPELWHTYPVLSNKSQRLQNAVNFRQGVVMHKANTHQAAFVQQPQPFHNSNSIVMAIPDKESLLTSAGGNFGWRITSQANSKGGRAFGQPFYIGNAINFQAAHGRCSL